jgi:hypothetical protein
MIIDGWTSDAEQLAETMGRRCRARRKIHTSERIKCMRLHRVFLLLAAIPSALSAALTSTSEDQNMIYLGSALTLATTMAVSVAGVMEWGVRAKQHRDAIVTLTAVINKLALQMTQPRAVRKSAQEFIAKQQGMIESVTQSAPPLSPQRVNEAERESAACITAAVGQF